MPSTSASGQAASKLAANDRLPVELRASIETALPGYGLPDPSAGQHPYTEMCETNSSAFLVVGDFTGHGVQEFALVLVKGHNLRFVIFSPDFQGQFHSVYLARPRMREEWGAHWEESLIEVPEQIDLCKIPKGQSWAPEAGDTFADVRVETDAIAIHTHPQRNYDVQALILYKNGEFQQLAFEPLVQLQ